MGFQVSKGNECIKNVITICSNGLVCDLQNFYDFENLYSSLGLQNRISLTDLYEGMDHKITLPVQL